MKRAANGSYVKLRREGGSVVMTVGSLLPPSWRLVRLVKEREVKDKVVIIRVEKVA